MCDGNHLHLLCHLAILHRWLPASQEEKPWETSISREVYRLKGGIQRQLPEAEQYARYWGNTKVQRREISRSRLMRVSNTMCFILHLLTSNIPSQKHIKQTNSDGFNHATSYTMCIKHPTALYKCNITMIWQLKIPRTRSARYWAQSSAPKLKTF